MPYILQHTAFLEISDGFFKEFNAVKGMTQDKIAVGAKKSSNGAGFVTVIDGEKLSLLVRFISPTHRANPALGLRHFVVLLRGHAVVSLPIPFPVVGLPLFREALTPTMASRRVVIHAPIVSRWAM